MNAHRAFQGHQYQHSAVHHGAEGFMVAPERVTEEALQDSKLMGAWCQAWLGASETYLCFANGVALGLCLLNNFF